MSLLTSLRRDQVVTLGQRGMKCAYVGEDKEGPVIKFFHSSFDSLGYHSYICRQF